MTPKDKAEELVRKYYTFGLNNPAQSFSWYECKECSLIAVEEMLAEYQSMSDLESKIVINDEVKFVVHQLIYWMEVKQEIEKL